MYDVMQAATQGTAAASKVVIFLTDVDGNRMLAARLKQEGIDPVLLQGGMQRKKRAQVRTAGVLLLSLALLPFLGDAGRTYQLRFAPSLSEHS